MKALFNWSLVLLIVFLPLLFFQLTISAGGWPFALLVYFITSLCAICCFGMFIEVENDEPS